jgi:hypothetical protein
MEKKRVQTSQHRLGNNSRTFIEGMLNKTAMDGPEARQTGHSNNTEPLEEHSKAQASSHNLEHEGTEAPRASGSNGQASRSIRQSGTGHPTVFESEEDAKMASRQTRITSMAPSERKYQENWAQSMLKRTGCCPEKYSWVRTRDDKGYQCEGLHHLITDNFLSKGHGGVWLLPHPRDTTIRYGPYYPHPKYKGTFLWGGKGVRIPQEPVFIDQFGSCFFESMLGRRGPNDGRRLGRPYKRRRSQPTSSQQVASSQNSSSQQQQSRGVASQSRGSQNLGSQNAGSERQGSEHTGSVGRSNRPSEQR